MKTLINICCAPCVLPLMDNSEGEKAFYFYSPNIYPAEEYLRRLEATREIAGIYNFPLLEGEYDHEAWLSFVKGELEAPPETYPENGRRCLACFQYRLDKTAAFAREKGFEVFATTLSLNRFKDTAFINKCGEALAGKYGIKYHTFTGDPHAAHKKGLELSKKHGVYRQKYCGCEFSLHGKKS